MFGSMAQVSSGVLLLINNLQAPLATETGQERTLALVDG